VHIEEYLALSTTWAGLSAPNAGEFETEALIAAARASGINESNIHQLKTTWVSDSNLYRDKSRDRRPYWIGLAATITLSCGVWFGYPQWAQSPDIRTAVGEQRSVTLADGSVVILNTDSEVRVRWTDTERRIELVKGEGQFHVAKNPNRPFLVATADATVRAVGTVFNVRNEQSGTQVAVLEGLVKVSALAPSSVSNLRPTGNKGAGPKVGGAALNNYDLGAGGRVAITPYGIEPDIGPSVESVAAWTQRRLVFRDQRLADVVAEFNRYRVQPLVIDEAELQGLRISGVFDLSDPESLLIYLNSFETVNVTRPDDGTLHLTRNAVKN
jgi:transmembrane sensor